MAKNKLPVAEVATAPAPAPKDDGERKYKAEDALRCIERAEEYKRDRSLMKDVKGLARMKIKALGKIK
jgi:hypothetical protein